MIFPNLCRSSIFSERQSYLILYTQIKKYSLVAGILFATSEQNVVGMPKARKVDGRVDGKVQSKAFFVESRVVLDSGLLQDVMSERL